MKSETGDAKYPTVIGDILVLIAEPQFSSPARIPEANFHPSHGVTCSGGTPARKPGRARSNLVRLLFTPPRAGRWHGQVGGERVLRPGAPRDSWFRGLGRSSLGAPGGWRAVGLCDLPTRRRRSRRGRRPEACVCALAQRPPGDLPRGCTRVHTRWVTARGSPGVPRVLPGWGGSQSPGPYSLGIPSPPPDAPPISPRAGCDFSPDQGNRSAQLEVAARPLSPQGAPRKPAAALRAAAPAYLNTPTRAGGFLSRVHPGRPGE